MPPNRRTPSHLNTASAPRAAAMDPAVAAYSQGLGYYSRKLVRRHWCKLHFIADSGGTIIEVRPRDNKIKYFVAFDLAQDVDCAAEVWREADLAVALANGQGASWEVVKPLLIQQRMRAGGLERDAKAELTVLALMIPYKVHLLQLSAQHSTSPSNLLPFIAIMSHSSSMPIRQSPRKVHELPPLNPKLPQSYLPSIIEEHRQAKNGIAANIPDSAFVALYFAQPQIASNFIMDHHRRLQFSLKSNGKAQVDPRPGHDATYQAYLMAVELGHRLTAKDDVKIALADAVGTPLHFNRLMDFFGKPQDKLMIAYRDALSCIPQE
ncbi:hypothetical protein C8F01DRAFT_1264038 [Mycena amicta]|nr:hypothetical protein C8F01DRAFT_1264038 [Mycena amicta]